MGGDESDSLTYSRMLFNDEDRGERASSPLADIMYLEAASNINSDTFTFTWRRLSSSSMPSSVPICTEPMLKMSRPNILTVFSICLIPSKTCQPGRRPPSHLDN